MTMRQAVGGVASSSAIGPHSQVQNASITSVAAGETPIPAPMSQASSPSAATSSAWLSSVDRWQWASIERDMA